MKLGYSDSHYANELFQTNDSLKYDKEPGTGCILILWNLCFLNNDNEHSPSSWFIVCVINHFLNYIIKKKRAIKTRSALTEIGLFSGHFEMC